MFEEEDIVTDERTDWDNTIYVLQSSIESAGRLIIKLTSYEETSINRFLLIIFYYLEALSLFILGVMTEAMINNEKTKISTNNTN